MRTFDDYDLNWVTREMRALLPKLSVMNSWDYVTPDFCKMRVYANADTDASSGYMVETQIDVPCEIIKDRDAEGLADLLHAKIACKVSRGPKPSNLPYSKVEIQAALALADKAFE